MKTKRGNKNALKRGKNKGKSRNFIVKYHKYSINE